MGSVRPGVPTLTVALRGMAMATIEVDDARRRRSTAGQFGGAAPDALLVLLRALASLHDEHGDVAVAGLRREEWTGESYSDDEFRELAEVLPGLPLHRHAAGSARASGRARRSRSPGIDVPSVDERAQRGLAVRAGEAQPARPPRAGRRRGAGRARPSPRGRAPVRDRARGPRRGDRQRLRGRHDRARRTRRRARRWRRAWGSAPRRSRRAAARSRSSARCRPRRPDAEILLVGATDGYANIHAPDERVLLDEFEKAIVAEAEFFGEYAAALDASERS